MSNRDLVGGRVHYSLNGRTRVAFITSEPDDPEVLNLAVVADGAGDFSGALMSLKAAVLHDETGINGTWQYFQIGNGRIQ